ncbi:gamma-interferon-inducible lysosomal thiol reductase-like protein [Leptotrombidium deliense]|uniref:Gamma-interferon-inducible lysosomal thiol reductase-like protein n=1 Tax=Leptotrombidium deliense TaxID=299467 RepID=A0A443S7Q8_9ACAR|nr:gamma-interferon-inducible lysosomal thiol reductase-like protein [Leptotrombidium deliense]
MAALLLLWGILSLFSNNPTNSLVNDDKVTVGLFYETYCPDCKQFVTNQLWPTFQSIGEIMNIDLVPYGFANVHEKLPNGTVTFKCQHGPRECKANMIHACVIHLVNDVKLVMSFVHCMESEKDPVTAARKCCDHSGISYTNINQCFTTQKGIDLLIEAGKRTTQFKPEITEVPWITINSVCFLNDQ